MRIVVPSNSLTEYSHALVYKISPHIYDVFEVYNKFYMYFYEKKYLNLRIHTVPPMSYPPV